MNPVNTTLQNGLKISTVHTPNSKKAVFTVLVKAGAIYEKDNEIGIFHLVEHCIFNGSKKYPTRKKVEEKIKELDIVDMVDTSMEFTKYTFSFHTKNSAEVIDFLFEILLNPLFEEKEIDKEKILISEERNVDKNYNYQRFYSQSKKIFFNGTVFEHDPIGNESSLQNIHSETLHKKHTEYYTPINMVCSYVGAENNSNVLKNIRKNIGEMPGGEKIPYPNVTLNKHEKREYIIHVSDTFDYMSLILPITYKKEEDNDLAYILQDILHSRIYRQIGYESGVGSTEFNSFAMLDIYSSFTEDKKEETAISIKEKIFKQKISEEEFNVAKKRLVENTEIMRENALDYAESLAYTLAAGKENKSFDDERKEIESLTFSNFKSFTEKVLDENNAVLFVSK